MWKVKAVVVAFIAFNLEKALVGAFSVITNLRMDLFEALLSTIQTANKLFDLQFLIRRTALTIIVFLKYLLDLISRKITWK